MKESKFTNLRKKILQKLNFFYGLSFFILKFAFGQETGLKRYELETFRNINLKFVRKRKNLPKLTDYSRQTLS